MTLGASLQNTSMAWFGAKDMLAAWRPGSAWEFFADPLSDLALDMEMDMTMESSLAEEEA